MDYNFIFKFKLAFYAITEICHFLLLLNDFFIYLTYVLAFLNVS